MLHVDARSIPDLLEGMRRSDGARLALSFYRGRTVEARLTRAEVLAHVERLAGLLQGSLGVRRGDRVAILSANRIEVPALLLAVMRIGAIAVPLNPKASTDDWRYILGHSGARVLIASGDRISGLVELGMTPLALEDLWTAAGATFEEAGDLRDEPAIVLYTSGTTGNPKGVMLSQANLCANAASLARTLALDGAVHLAVLPLYHAHALGLGLMTSLLTGGHLVFVEQLNPFAWAEVVRVERVEVTSVVPPLLPLLLQARVTAEQVPSLRWILVSSAPLSVDAARAFEERTGIRLVHGWGLSEYTNFACCLSPADSPEEHGALLFGREVPSVGPALHDVEVRVVDAAGRPLPEGARGELWVRGPSAMLSYYRDDAATRAVFNDGWLRTGDEGCVHLDHGRAMYYISGRLKEVIIRDGDKHSPLALERKLLIELPELVGRLAVVGFPHHAHGEEVGAYLEVEVVDGALHERLLSAVARMSPEERPKVLLHGPLPLPRTHTGKVQRHKLLPLFAAFAEHRGRLRIERVG